MKTIPLKLATSAVLLAVLSACGGGGSSGAVDQPAVAATPEAVSAAPATTTVVPTVVAVAPVVANPLEKYVGVWKGDCNQAARGTFTITNPRNDGTLDASSKEEVYEKFGCTGSVISTGIADPGTIKITFLETVQTATIKNQLGQIRTGSIDRVTRSYPASSYTFTGAGFATNVVDGKATIWTIPLADGNTQNYRIQNPAETITGGVALFDKDLYILRAFDIPSNTYPISVRAVRLN